MSVSLRANKARYKTAVALQYETKSSSKSAPIVCANSRHQMADEIVKIANRYGVPVVERPNLAQALSGLAPLTTIPESLYEAVAIIFNQIDRLYRK